jgi:hypothetical protein
VRQADNSSARDGHESGTGRTAEPQRSRLGFGGHVREVRRGKPGQDSPYLLTVGVPGFGFRSGEVWSLHVGWIGPASTSRHSRCIASSDTPGARHPGLEIESCASGGGRVDLGTLDRTDRVWASDRNDPVERQVIQRWTAQPIPPELLGSHVGPERSHTTRRVTAGSIPSISIDPQLGGRPFKAVS